MTCSAPARGRGSPSSYALASRSSCTSRYACASRPRSGLPHLPGAQAVEPRSRGRPSGRCAAVVATVRRSTCRSPRPRNHRDEGGQPGPTCRPPQGRHEDLVDVQRLLLTFPDLKSEEGAVIDRLRDLSAPGEVLTRWRGRSLRRRSRRTRTRGIDDAAQVASIEYLLRSQLPLVVGAKLSILDVRCKDQAGTTFVVEMQLVHASRRSSTASSTMPARLMSGQLEARAKYKGLAGRRGHLHL